VPTFDDEKQKRQLDELRAEEEENLIRVLAESKYNLPYINLKPIPVENEALRTVPEEEARKWEAAPFRILGKNLHIAVFSPNKSEVKEMLESLAVRGFKVFLYMASHASLEKVWSRYKELSLAESSKAGGLDVSGEVLTAIGAEIKSLADVPKIIEDRTKEVSSHRISRMLEVVLAGAIAIDASDVHIEPQEKDIRLRYRVDGVLQEVMVFTPDIFKMLGARIKLLSGLKLSSEATAQDGRFSIWISKDEINVRVSTVPGAYGEGFVMRLLNPKSIRVGLEELGIEPNLFSIIEKEINRPQGMILVTGPTGSGKTTTLYAFLRKIYSPEIKMITIEDPIEYHLPGITQTQVESKRNYTFLSGLRAAMRQDPDIIMVGEIRDSETAATAVDAALTGHIVFSTLHTNNAAGVVPRLLDLEVNAKILPSALTMSLAQRLVRKLCNHCKKERAPTEEEEKLIRDIIKKGVAMGKDFANYGISAEMPLKIFDAVGCVNCSDLGFKGRIGVFEGILTDNKIAALIAEKPSDREINKAASEQGIFSMREDGIIKVLRGVTSLEELKSNVDLYFE
jgi:type II secretory ATPase GspE/PulE/Tfp pilus assembly ATPase PilB-like protein